MNPPPKIEEWAERRRVMVERQLWARGIRDPRVLQAMRQIPRERFVPEESRHLSYDDEPVAIGFAQTISQPYMTALMTECLGLAGTETLLDVGSGCGYHAAVLGALAARVVSIDIIPELVAMAQKNLEETGLGGNVTVICGDGSGGYPACAPYDAISVAAAAPEVPAALLEQLKDMGTIVIPIGSQRDQELRVITRSQGEWHSRMATYCRFVPLVGDAGFFRKS